MSGKKIHATFSVMWEKTILTKQTLFPVWGDKEDRKARKGSPPDTEYTLRATKGVNMHPFPILRLDRADGSSYTEEEMIRLSLVCATDKLPPPVGSCTCGGVPILTESKPLQLHIDHGETITKIRGGVLEFTKLQIGCCTGQRGHNCALCIKAEFVGEKSLLKGLVVYSLPIEVGAKGPFAKIFTKGQAVEEEAPSEVVEDRAMDAIVPINTAIPTPSYEGAEEMVALLKKLNLHKYIHLFAAQEVDIQAFLQLTDSDLNEIGITKVGPRVKILKEIARIKEGRTLPLPVPSLQLLPPTPVPALPQLPAQSEDSSQTPLIPIPRTPSLSRMPSLPSFSFDSSSLSSPMLASFFQDETSEPTSKRRKTLEGFPSSGSFIENEDKGVSIYIYLSNIVASNNILKKTLFMVKSEKNKWETEQIVQQIQHQVVSDLSQKGKYVFHEGKAQVMLILQPGKNGIEWQAKSAHSEQIWNFKKGDYIKIDNHHNVDISINVHYYYIPSASKTTSDKLFVEDFRSPKKYPTLFPGGSLEIGIDENRDGRLALAAELDFEPSETFAVTKNGKLIPVTNEPSTLNETCNFSFKRRKDSMKKAESFDDFQKEIFLSKVLDPAML